MPEVRAPLDGVVTFMRVPFTRDLSRATAAILGIPYDMGVHPTRIGARPGPAAIREQSSLVRPYQPPQADWSPIERLGLVDVGDVALTASRVPEAFAAIEAAVSAIVEAAVVHLDAHTDTSPGEGCTTGTTFTCAAEEGVLDVAHTVHVGARGTLYQPGNWDHCRAKGYELVPAALLVERGVPQVAAHLRRRLAGRPVYLCVDMDFFDASCAPGVCAPTFGGPLAREGLALVQGLAGLDVVACDVNTVSPPHDVGGMTAFLAATVVLECLTLVARRNGRAHA